MNGAALAPMPEEPFEAHEGRIRYFFGLRTAPQFRRFVQQTLSMDSAAYAASNRLTRLASLSSIPWTEYLRHHTLYGAVRVANPLPSQRDGAGLEPARNILFRKSSPRFCATCAQEDLEHWGFSWYRRSHQVEGVDWCPLHRTQLVRCTSRDPWAMLPHLSLQAGEFEQQAHIASVLVQGPYESRFTEVACDLLERAQPFDVRRLGEVLVRQARDQKVRTTHKGNKPCVSDLLRSHASNEWLRQYWPEVLDRPGGSFIQTLDKLSNYVASRAGLSYITAIAVLWDTAAQAHAALQEAADTDASDRPPTGQARAHRAKGFWHGDAWHLYVSHGGNHRSIARELGTQPQQLGRRMLEEGLPSLHGTAGSAEWRAFHRFQAGDELSVACHSEGANRAEVEQLLRIGSTPLHKAVKAISRRQSKPRQPKTKNGRDSTSQLTTG